MTRLANDPKRFAAEAVSGFVAAHPTHVQAVPGGVIRAAESSPGEVAVVVGGGSGHYPAFAGWVGPGMAHAAVCGNVFASPSSSQVYSVARAADNGGGILLAFGNYAGDVLQFGQAAQRLRAEGVDVRVVTVTDDIASGPADESGARRGIAGDLLVLKVAGAAARRGDDLHTVEEVTRRANARTRSLGVAFAGCTLPGFDRPLFEVPAGTVALGLGIHGEPGIADFPLTTADAVADRLVDGVLAEEPERGVGGYTGRVAVLLNGLGATKYEELFVAYRRVAERLQEAGLEIVAPEVGEHVTSLDMAGLSLSVMFLDDELAELWTAPVDTPAFRRGTTGTPTRRRATKAVLTQETRVPAASSASQLAAKVVLDALRRATAAAHSAEQELGDLDAVAGDGDHGQGMALGTAGALSRAQEVVRAGAGVGTTLVQAGTAWSDAAGGTSGALWGAGLAAAGDALGDEDLVTPEMLVRAVERARDAVLDLGGARPGDKTMVDALVPFADVLRREHNAGAAPDEALARAARAAREAAEATSRIVARRGRARTHGENSLGHPDPGATSFALLATAMSDVTILTDR